MLAGGTSLAVGVSLDGGGSLAAGSMSIFEAVVPVVIGFLAHYLVASNRLQPSEGEAEQSRNLEVLARGRPRKPFGVV